MVWKELLNELRGEGLVSESKVRWAIDSGKVARPPLDGSLRFVFGEDHLRQLRLLFQARRGP